VNPADWYPVGLVVAGIDTAAARYRLEARPSAETLSAFAYHTDDRALFPDRPGFLKSMAALPNTARSTS